MVNADADQLDRVGLINDCVPTEMDVDAGTIVLGLVWETLVAAVRWIVVEEFCAHQATE